MPSPPPRFSRDTLAFITRASRQKNPEWLGKNRSEYERHLLVPLQHLAQHLKDELARDATGYHFPMRGLARLKRSALRSREYGGLYKNWVAYQASRPAESRFDSNPNLYLLIQPGDPDGDEVLIAGGLYNPSSRQLRAIREAISTDATAFERLFASKAFGALFPGGFSPERIATRPPRGFDPKHPKIEWLKLQAFFVWRPYRLREFTAPSFGELVARDCRQILRLNELLDRAIAGRWVAMRRAKTVEGPSRLLPLLDGLQAPRRDMDF